MWNGMKIIDADAHMHEPKYLWKRDIEPKYRKQVPKVAFLWMSNSWSTNPTEKLFLGRKADLEPTARKTEGTN
jgi:hypothetical protein